MRPLGQTRPLLAYGVPAAAGLVAGGALAAQGEDPGSALLGGVAAGLGARGALGAARLAGKYAGSARSALASQAIEGLGAIGQNVPAGSKRAAALRGAMGPMADVINRGVSREAAAIAGVPLAGAAAGLGGLAAGSLAGELGIPGFQQGTAIDPESYSSNNTPSAQFGVTQLASTRYA
jgi:hypothetical protein